MSLAQLSLNREEAKYLSQAAFEHRASYEGGRDYRALNRTECEVADSVLAGLHDSSRAYLLEPRWGDAGHVLSETINRSDSPYLIAHSRDLLARLRQANADRRKAT
jgi:hypothetical protein